MYYKFYFRGPLKANTDEDYIWPRSVHYVKGSGTKTPFKSNYILKALFMRTHSSTYRNKLNPRRNFGLLLCIFDPKVITVSCRAVTTQGRSTNESEKRF